MTLSPIVDAATKRLERGFTLVEILVVITIIIILSGFVTTAVYNGRIEARDLSRVSDLQQIKLGLKLYKDAHGAYPDYPNGVEIGVGAPIDEELRPFLGDLHADPRAETSGGGEYGYWYDSFYVCNGEARVVVMAQFENETGNYASDCAPIAEETSLHDADNSLRAIVFGLLSPPKAQASYYEGGYYAQKTYYSQGYYQATYYSQGYYQATYYTQATYYSQGYYQATYYNQATYYTQSTYYTQNTYYSQQVYYSQSSYYAQGTYYNQATYYAQSSYYAQSGYYTQSVYYSEGNYYGESAYYSQSGYSSCDSGAIDFACFPTEHTLIETVGDAVVTGGGGEGA